MRFYHGQAAIAVRRRVALRSAVTEARHVLLRTAADVTKFCLFFFFFLFFFSFCSIWFFFLFFVFSNFYFFGDERKYLIRGRSARDRRALISRRVTRSLNQRVRAFNRKDGMQISWKYGDKGCIGFARLDLPPSVFIDVNGTT